MDKAVSTFFIDAEKVNINKKLVLRFLKVTGEATKEIEELLDDCICEFKTYVSYKACYRLFDVKKEENSLIFQNEMVLNSESLRKNLSGCDRAFVFVATTSLSTDRLIHKYSSTQVSRALVIDAVASAAVEAFCDILCEKFKSEFSADIAPRFSPGYGDLDISVQKQVTSVCDATRKVGVTLSKKFTMIPRKSVSAIVGIKSSSVGVKL